MRFRSVLSLSAAASLVALLSLATPAKAVTVASGTAVVTFVNNSGQTPATGTAILDTEPPSIYPNVAPGSSFITYANGAVPPGNTTYSTTFTGFTLDAGFLTFAADDTTTALLNGNFIGSTGASPYDTLFTFFVPTTDFVNGNNVLSFVVTNGATFPNPTGLDFSLTANTPEPGSLVLLGTGVLGVAGAIRRRVLA